MFQIIRIIFDSHTQECSNSFLGSSIVLPIFSKNCARSPPYHRTAEYDQLVGILNYCLTGCFISFSNSESGLSKSSSGLKKFVIMVAKTLLL